MAQCPWLVPAAPPLGAGPTHGGAPPHHPHPGRGPVPRGPEGSLFQDYTRHVVLPAHGKTVAGLEVYVRTATTTRASLLWGKEDANALLIEVLTPWGRHHVLAAHAPQVNIGVAHT